MQRLIVLYRLSSLHYSRIKITTRQVVILHGCRTFVNSQFRIQVCVRILGVPPRLLTVYHSQVKYTATKVVISTPVQNGRNRESRTSMSDADPVAYITEIEAWRRQREADLRTPDGWLSLTGLYVLGEGTYTVGSDLASDVVLPASAPTRLGEIAFHAGEALLTITTDAAVLVDGVPLRSAQLIDNAGGRRPTLVTEGTVSFFIHRFGNQHAVRVKDSTNPAIAAFEGRRWFPVQPQYRVQGEFTPFADPYEVQIGTVVNTASTYRSIGAVAFELGGHKLQLLASAGGAPNQLFFVLRDATAGVETYGAARFLTTDVAPDGSVDLDFNKAYNPPCAFTPYATCPLPPRDNILPVRIAAGELYPH